MTKETINFSVGEIVTVKENGKKAFVEEIILTPYVDGVTRRQKEHGKYSLYALEPTREILHDGDWYIGDTLGDDIETTGDVMTVEQLREYQRKFTGGFAKDFDVVIKNLGRSSGKNE